MCESKELIVGYVYDELSNDERATVDRHLVGCVECRIEIEELRSTRTHLTLWAPPEPDLGFRVIRGGAAAAPALPRRSRLVPAFAFAAAAVIVLAAAAAIAKVEVRYGSEGLMVRTGWTTVQTPEATTPSRVELAGAGTPAANQAVPASVMSADFVSLDRRLRELEAALAQAPAGSVQTASASGMSDVEILRRVREMVREAEARQQTVVTERLLEVMKDFDRQRRTDLAMIQQGLGQYQGLTNAEIAQNRDMVNQLNQLVRAAATKQEK